MTQMWDEDRYLALVGEIGAADERPVTVDEIDLEVMQEVLLGGDDVEDEPEDKGAKVRLGMYKFFVEREVYEEWKAELVGEFGEVIFSSQPAWLKPASSTLTEALSYSAAAFSVPSTNCSYSGLPATTPGTNTAMLNGSARGGSASLSPPPKASPGMSRHRSNRVLRTASQFLFMRFSFLFELRCLENKCRSPFFPGLNKACWRTLFKHQFRFFAITLF